MMPLAASAEALYVDHAFKIVLWLSIPFIHWSWPRCFMRCSFSAPKGTVRKGKSLTGASGRWVETLWIGASLVLTLGLAAFGSIELKRLHATQKPPIWTST
jgi:hypothetical protein